MPTNNTSTTDYRRVTEALMVDKVAQHAKNEPMLDLKFGGQFGFSPKLGAVSADGKAHFSEWISNHKYISMNVIPIIIEYPRFFDLMNDGESYKKTLKALVELHSRNIDGLASGLTVETAEFDVGGAGEKQEEIVNVTRARSVPVHTWEEKAGKPVNRFLTDWIRYGLMDPDTKSALISTLGGIKETEVYTPDFYSMTVLYIEPNITKTNVVEAWLCTNMFPKSNGEVTGKRDLSSAGEGKSMAIEFTSITMYNHAVRDLATKTLAAFASNKVDPNDLVNFVDGIDANLIADKYNGYDGPDGTDHKINTFTAED